MDGSSLVSASGKYRLVLQSDGNLVLYWEGHPLWNSGTRNDAPDHLVMQNDGNLVMYQGLQVLWSSGSGGGVRSNDYYLTVQNDGDAIIYSPAQQADLDDQHRRTAGIAARRLRYLGPQTPGAT